MDVRKATNKILEMIDEGLLSPISVVEMCLKWMSEDDVKEMCEANEIDFGFDEEEEAEEHSNPYIINVGESRFNMQPFKSAATEEEAIALVDALHKVYRCVDAVYMPEDDLDTNELIYSWYCD